jgi:hypothetical protein
MNHFSLLIFSITASLASLTAFAQQPDQPVADQNDEADVKAAVESFLTSLGNGENEKVKALFLPHANIAYVSRSNGESRLVTITAEEYMSQRAGKRKFKEPVRQFAVNISQGTLAFVRADATVYYNEVADHHTQDFFILMKDHGAWKILSGSFTSEPLTKGN